MKAQTKIREPTAWTVCIYIKFNFVYILLYKLFPMSKLILKLSITLLLLSNCSVHSNQIGSGSSHCQPETSFIV